MSLMNAAEIAELDKMFGAGAAEAIEAGAGEAKEEAAAKPEVEAKEPVQAEKPVQAQEPAQTEMKAEEEEIRPVPYRRFQEVNAAKREAEAKAQALKARAEELEAKLAAVSEAQAAKQAKGQKTWLDSILDGDSDEGTAAAQQTGQQDEIPAWAKQMRETLESIQQERQMLELDRTVGAIRQHYPDMPEEVVLSGLADGRSPEEIVQAWDYVGRAYAKAHGFVPQPSQTERQQAAVPSKSDVAPRLPVSRGQMNAPEPKAWVSGWGKEHQQAVAEFIKTQG